MSRWRDRAWLRARHDCRSGTAGQAGGGAVENGPSVSAPKMITSIAPSDAPADTPSVNGVASGLRSIA